MVTLATAPIFSNVFVFPVTTNTATCVVFPSADVWQQDLKLGGVKFFLLFGNTASVNKSLFMLMNKS